MALTREFKETVRARAQRDRRFRDCLLKEASEAFLAGDVETGKTVLRDYVNATIGFEELGRAVRKSPKSLHRMLSAAGNPRADNLFSILRYLQECGGVRLAVRATPVERS